MLDFTESYSKTLKVIQRSTNYHHFNAAKNYTILFCNCFNIQGDSEVLKVLLAELSVKEKELGILNKE